MEASLPSDNKCLNCGHNITGNYCSFCGQKTHVHREGFLHMVIHFIADYFHYDHKFFKTIKALVTRPGELTLAYRMGKRAAFIHPIQLYIFISAVAFIVFYSVFKPNVVENKDGFSINWVNAHHGQTDGIAYDHYDTVVMKQVIRIGTKPIMDSASAMASRQPVDISFNYGLVQFYKYFARYTYRKHIFLYSDALSKLLNTYIHSIPKLFFVLMPWFGLLLRISFGRKGFLYVDHAIMSLHFHSFIFLTVIAGLLLCYIPDIPMKLPAYFLLGIITIYLFLACHRFYGKHWFYTLIMSLLIWAVYLFTVGILSILNLFLTMALA